VTYLLDTNVISEVRKRNPARSVTRWMSDTPAGELHVSVLTLGEIEQGIVRLRARGDLQQATSIERWLRGMEEAFTARAHGLTVATRNVKDFERAHVPVINPFTA